MQPGPARRLLSGGKTLKDGAAWVECRDLTGRRHEQRKAGQGASES